MQSAFVPNSAYKDKNIPLLTLVRTAVATNYTFQLHIPALVWAPLVKITFIMLSK